MNTTWQRVATIAMFIGAAVTAMVMHENTLAATLVGIAGGMAIPPMTPPAASLLPASTSNGNGNGGDPKKGGNP